MKPCAIDGCDKPAHRGGGRYCSMHYSRKRRNGDPNVRTLRVLRSSQPCEVDGCDRPQAARGLCNTHDQHRRRRGDPRAPWNKPPHWTARETARLVDALEGVGWGSLRPGEAADVGQALGRSASSVRSKASKLRRSRRRMEGAPE